MPWSRSRILLLLRRGFAFGNWRRTAKPRNCLRFAVYGELTLGEDDLADQPVAFAFGIARIDHGTGRGRTVRKFLDHLFREVDGEVRVDFSNERHAARGEVFPCRALQLDDSLDVAISFRRHDANAIDDE